MGARPEKGGRVLRHDLFEVGALHEVKPKHCPSDEKGRAGLANLGGGDKKTMSQANLIENSRESQKSNGFGGHLC